MPPKLHGVVRQTEREKVGRAARARCEEEDYS